MNTTDEARLSWQHYVTAELGRDLTPRCVPGTPPPERRSWSLSELAALPGVVVTCDEAGTIIAVLFRGDHASQQDIDEAENDAIQEAANRFNHDA